MLPEDKFDFDGEFVLSSHDSREPESVGDDRISAIPDDDWDLDRAIAVWLDDGGPDRSN